MVRVLQRASFVAMLIASLSLLVVACSGGSTQPIEFKINSTADGADARPGNDVCETAPGNDVCTLRAAIMEANALKGFKRILVPEGAYTLTIPGRGENSAATGDLDITGDLEIKKSGDGLVVVNGNGIDRVLEVFGGIRVTINGLYIQGGRLPDGWGEVSEILVR